MKTHKDLDVWKRGIDLVTRVYQITKQFPPAEAYGLSGQMQRAAVSFPSNIAEGAARKSNKEFIPFLYVALSSLSELETQCIIAENLEYIPEQDNILSEIENLRRMTLGLIKYLKKD